jgi:hypothetical protein
VVGDVAAPVDAVQLDAAPFALGGVEDQVGLVGARARAAIPTR